MSIAQFQFHTAVSVRYDPNILHIKNIDGTIERIAYSNNLKFTDTDGNVFEVDAFSDKPLFPVEFDTATSNITITEKE